MSIPGIVSILQRAGQLPSLHTRRLRLAAELADLYVRPPVEQFKILDFSIAEPRSTSATSTGRWQSANGYQPVVDPRCAPGAALFSPDKASTHGPRDARHSSSAVAIVSRFRPRNIP